MFFSTFLFRISTKALVYVFLRHFAPLFYILIFLLLELTVNWPLNKKGYLPKYKNKWHLSLQSSFTILMYPLTESARHFRKYHLLFWLFLNETLLTILLGNDFISFYVFILEYFVLVAVNCAEINVLIPGFGILSDAHWNNMHLVENVSVLNTIVSTTIFSGFLSTYLVWVQLGF